MLDSNLIYCAPKELYSPITEDIFFFGYKIKNLYDEKRLHISESFKPKRFLIKENHFYGINLDINDKLIRKIINDIKQKKPFDYIGYNQLLLKYNLSYDNNVYELTDYCYPVDNVHIKKFIPNFNVENFIYINPEIPAFQSFSSLNLYLILND
jgi:hypothetical protein